MGGWHYGQCKDSDAEIFAKEKGIGDEHPVRLASNPFLVVVTAYLLTSTFTDGHLNCGTIESTGCHELHNSSALCLYVSKRCFMCSQLNS